eukprot:307870_1
MASVTTKSFSKKISEIILNPLKAFWMKLHDSLNPATSPKNLPIDISQCTYASEQYLTQEEITTCNSILQTIDMKSSVYDSSTNSLLSKALHDVLNNKGGGEYVNKGGYCTQEGYWTSLKPPSKISKQSSLRGIYNDSMLSLSNWWVADEYYDE